MCRHRYRSLQLPHAHPAYGPATGERFLGCRNAALLATDRPRYVIRTAEIVEDCAANARRCKRAERQPTARVEALDRVDQTNAARTYQIVQARFHTERRQHLPGYVANQGQMAVEKAFPSQLITVDLPGLPERRRFHGVQLSRDWGPATWVGFQRELISRLR
jgi:hypothetical protein